MTMAGRVCLVTGATSGIGKATAHALAGLGASVVILGRRPAELDAVAAEMRASTGNDDVTVALADLASLESIRRLADRFRAEHDRLHVLINNAGVNLNHRSVTVDGFETTFAVNHLAPFLLTNLLLDLLKRSAPSRVVSVASTAFRRGRIDFDDLQAERSFSGFRVYSQSKLANVLFTTELARRLEGTGVTANCVHPGVVRGTGLGRGERFPLAVRVIWPLIRPVMKSPEQGARTSVYTATSPDLEDVSGRLFINSRPARISAAADDRALAERLWTVSAQLAGLA
jgi:NAD(P)-dependent dehydrogenase (short-subunit alcohol dehydrogenase family)